MSKRSFRRGGNRDGSVIPSVPFEDENNDPRTVGLRQARLREVIREELSLLLRDDVRDPMLEGASVSLVELSDDCRSARVHVVTTRPGDSALVERALERACKYLRASLGDALNLKFVPQLRFRVAAITAPGSP